jgi:hypothetical protein
MPLPIEIRNPSKTVSRLSLLTAVVASQAYLIYAAFFAHALTPVGVFAMDPRTHLHRVNGQIGNIEAVFHWDGLISTILISIRIRGRMVSGTRNRRPARKFGIIRAVHR